MASVARVATTGAVWVWGAQRRTRALRLPLVPTIVMTILVTCAIFAPLLSRHDPRSIQMLEAKTAPFESWNHPLGTDVMGRDMLARLIYGAQTTLKISLVALGAGALVGTILGLISGYMGRWTDTLIMRAADAALGFPTILVAMIIVTLLGAGIMNIIAAVGLTVWARFTRMIRGDVLSIKELDFVTLAHIAGVSPTVIIVRHLFPNVVNTMMVITSLLVGNVILTEASLSFLGLGLAPGEAAWGIMVAEGRSVILSLWWLSLFPGLAITVVVAAFNFFGDWLRDTLDPKLRRI